MVRDLPSGNNAQPNGKFLPPEWPGHSALIIHRWALGFVLARLLCSDYNRWALLCNSKIVGQRYSINMHYFVMLVFLPATVHRWALFSDGRIGGDRWVLFRDGKIFWTTVIHR
jgi:hypothetical protein